MSSKPVHAIIDRDMRLLREGLYVLTEQFKAYSESKGCLPRLEKLHERVGLEERLLRARFSRELMNPPAPPPAVTEPRVRRVTPAGEPLSDFILQRFKACEEAARSLEEYFRFFELGKYSAFYRQVRFELYELEREAAIIWPPELHRESAQLLGPLPANQRVRQALQFSPLYFILDDSICSSRDPLKVAFDAIAGGVRVMQLRFKRLNCRELTDLARKLKRICEDRQCLLIINDRLDVAMIADADGVHLGAEDSSVADAKRISPNLLVGATVRKAQAAVEGQAEGADYLGCGSIFPSTTKPGLPLAGLRGLGRVCESVEIPVVAIGGITAENCRRTIEAGAAGFCSVSPFTRNGSIKNLAAELRAKGLESPR